MCLWEWSVFVHHKVARLPGYVGELRRGKRRGLRPVGKLKLLLFEAGLDKILAEDGFVFRISQVVYCSRNFGF